MQAIAQRRFRTVAVGRKTFGAPGSGLRTMSSRSGQSLIESCIVIVILCLVLFGSLQVSQIFMAREILDHAAVCGARAKAVGFNEFMVQKTIRVAAIPLAGQMTQPSPVYSPRVIQQPHSIDRAWRRALSYRGSSAQVADEYVAIPFYLGSGNWGEAAGYLDYQLDYLNKYGWTYAAGSLTKTPNINQSVTLRNLVNTTYPQDDNVAVTVHVQHDFPLNFGLHRAFFQGQDDLMLKGQATIESHYKLYLE